MASNLSSSNLDQDVLRELVSGTASAIGENRSTIKDFYGALKEDDSREEPFVFTNGEPPVLLGNNEGANPAEFMLHGLAGCVTTAFILHASARGV